MSDTKVTENVNSSMTKLYINPLRDYPNPFKVIVPLHDYYNRIFIFIYYLGMTPLSYPITEEIIESSPEWEFKKIFYTVLNDEEVST